MDELRQLVEARAAQEPAAPGDPRVVRDDAVGVFAQPHCPAALNGVPNHRPELEHPERPCVLAGPDLAVKHWSAGVQEDPDRDRQQHGREQKQEEEGEDRVGDPLDCAGYHRPVRVALIDAGAYTPPYDDRLAGALAARGHDVTLLTAPFRFGEAPEPVGYRRDELFFPLSSGLFRRAPRSRARLPLKTLEYGPSMRRVRRRLETIAPEIVHFQWLFRPEIDLRWLRAVAATRPTVFTAHDLAGMLSRRRGAWLRVLEAVERVVVHSRRGVEELAAPGIPHTRIVRIPHPVFVNAGEVAVDGGRGQTLLFF